MLTFWLAMLLASTPVEPPEQPDPRRDPMRGIDPAALQGLCDDRTGYCDWPPFLKPWNLYVLAVDDAQVMAIAKESPPAAMYAAIMQVDGLARPMPAEVNDSVHSSMITAESIGVLLRGEAGTETIARAWKPLEADVGFLTRSRVDRLRNGRRVIVVESELLHHPTLSTVGVPYPPFAIEIEIERVIGETLPNGDNPGNPARVWRVVSWGAPESYYR